MFAQAYLNTAQEILKEYEGREPFHIFLKKFFSINKKFGCRDRKQITHLCYCFFRLGKALKEIPVSEKLILGLFLCDAKKNILLQKLDAHRNGEVESDLDGKMAMVKREFNFQQKDIFPFSDHVSDAIELNYFIRSLLIQPLLFLRIRPGNEKQVKQKLLKGGILFELINDDSLALQPATKLDEVLEINKEAVVQDINSQHILGLLMQHIGNKQIKTAWDCCAASGGKSILLKDNFPEVQLTVSDIRESILVNLKKRFYQAGIKNYKKLVADIATSPLKSEEKFDLVICDAPCTGSGTWSRTPEQLHFFYEKKIEEYASLQKEIVTNAVKSCKKGGLFLYITCSVFKKENEEVVAFLQNDLALHLISLEYVKGYQEKADTLFAALFTL